MSSILVTKWKNREEEEFNLNHRNWGKRSFPFAGGQQQQRFRAEKQEKNVFQGDITLWLPRTPVPGDVFVCHRKQSVMGYVIL